MSEKEYIPTEEVAKSAAKGLKLREEFGHGGTVIGLNRAKELSAKKPISASKIKRMVSYFARHEVDKKADNFGDAKNPSKGYIAWLLWGGDAGKKWAEGIKEALLNDEKSKD